MRNIFSFETSLWTNYNDVLSSIQQLETEIQTYSNNELKQKSLRLKNDCRNSSLKRSSFEKKILVESFALVREAAYRTLGLRHYDTQLLGGLVLNDNKIAEMRTGEGKTLVATAPALFNALDGKGVHIVTVNDYLARRDAEWMGQIYRFLGFNVGLIQASMKPAQRRKNYDRDITYVTNSELGFDFLRDNLVIDADDLVQRSLNYCIIDEVDSILIDEARTPLIISGPGEVDLEKILKANEIVPYISKGEDFEIDEKAKNISLTTAGYLKIQKLLNVDDLYDPKDPWIPFVLNAIRANFLYFLNVHYIRKNDEIVIVDEFTGRVMEGRRWSDGLHNAIEAKEQIYSMQGSETIAAITYQNLFRLYPKISGMTGTAKTEELEFEKIYNLQVSVLPTFKPIQRVDFDDLIFIDEIGKWKAVAQECKKMFALKRPVLVGTTTIRNSEILSLLLDNFGIPHQLLNAKPENIKREAEIIAEAGCLSSITIATNMAGRGTDILLGGNAEYKTYKQTFALLEAIVKDQLDYADVLLSENETIYKILKELEDNREELETLEEDFLTLLSVITIPNKVLNQLENLVFQLYSQLLAKNQLAVSKEKQQVIDLGGLYVIGTERHESRRIDNQLRGRAGRQGDPGSSRFFLSLNDYLLKAFGGDSIKRLMQTFQISDDALESKFLSSALESAQRKIEGFYYDQRKTVHKYDRILDQQRYLIYTVRRKILFSKTTRDLLFELGETFIENFLNQIQKSTRNGKGIKEASYLFYDLNLSLETMVSNKINNLVELKPMFYEQLWSMYCLKELGFWFYDFSILREYEKIIFLKNIDIYWSIHLQNMSFLRDAVSWSGYAQKDPFFLYEEKAAGLFQKTFRQCRDSILYNLFTIEII